MKKLKLFCLPFAGGTAMTYNKWRRKINKLIEVCPIELAGRGVRLNEDFYDTFEEAVEDVFDKLKCEIDDESEYAIFGHSMGSWMALELYYKIMESGHKKPIHMFFSGNEPPHMPKDEMKIHDLPLNELKEEVMKLGGTSEVIFDDEDMASIFVPIIRSDYRLVENFEFVMKDKKVNCETTVLYGNFDKFEREKIFCWQDLIDTPCEFVDIDGGHFFINDLSEEVLSVINKKLLLNI